jgi:hypothetical protein
MGDGGEGGSYPAAMMFLIRPCDIETVHPQTVEDFLRQRLREARIALLQDRKGAERGERIDLGEAMIAERTSKLLQRCFHS